MSFLTKIFKKKTFVKKVKESKGKSIKKNSKLTKKTPKVKKKSAIDLGETHDEVHARRVKVKEAVKRLKPKSIQKAKKVTIWTGIKGFDALLDDGIIKGTAIIVAGGTGTGKTILSLQLMDESLKKGEKCLYMTLEESEGKLLDHMNDFGWDGQAYCDKKQLLIKRINPFDLVRSVDALLARAKGELLIDINPIILPDGFVPDKIFIDSLTAMAAAFTEKDETYRIYIEQFFKYLESTKATSFLITETDQLPTRFSPTGVEEFLADGVVVLYNVRLGSSRQRAIEILKMRGVAHKHSVVGLDITKDGMEIFPKKEIIIKHN